MNNLQLWNDTTLQQKQKFLCLIEALSPENLHEDGEISNRQADQKEKKLMKQWRLLEKEIRREVTEEEIWEQLAFTDLDIDDNDPDAIVRFDLRQNKWTTAKEEYPEDFMVNSRNITWLYDEDGRKIRAFPHKHGISYPKQLWQYPTLDE